MSLPVPLKDIFVKYREWVIRNPQTTSEIESTFKWISYFLAGRISNSAVLSELVYSVSSLLVLFNDNIIRKSQSLHPLQAADRLKIWLTVLEYSEVFIEVSAFRKWGSSGRWVVITLIQAFKCAARFSLLYQHKENIVQIPPIIPLRRNEIDKPTIQPQPEGFTLKSGRVIRTVDAAAPVMYREWKPPELPQRNNLNSVDATLTSKQMLGEALYIIKPLTHLAALYRYGPHSWRPWLMAAAIDLTSLYLLQGDPQAKFSRRQRMELSRRTVSLMFYLLRSPFYEARTRDHLLRLLASCSDNIPLVGIILRPLAEYLPHWQKTYFYMWSK